MNLQSKQQTIIDEIRKSGSITTKMANQKLAGYYYHNGEKYVGEILSRMVANGKIKRVKVGLYELGSGREDIAITNQEKLF